MVLIPLLLTPLLAACLCFLLRRRAWVEGVHLLSSAGIFAASLWLASAVSSAGAINFLEGFLYADSLSALLVLLTSSVSLITAPYTIGYFRHASCGSGEGSVVPPMPERRLREYYSLTHLFLFTLLLVSLTGNLGVMWVALEGATLASIFLVAFYGEPKSLEAAWKYAIIGGVGLSMALFGTILTYHATHQATGAETWNALNWPFLLASAHQFDPLVMRLAFVFILLGYGAKAGLAPMHTWKPDAYSQAPAPAATLLATAMVNCSLYALARFTILAGKATGAAFTSKLLILFGVLSIGVAVPFILVQRSHRRLLAYSSIDHCGIMILGFGFGGPLGSLGALLHMVFHSLAKPLLFFCAGNAQLHTGNDALRRTAGGLVHPLPITGAGFLVAAVAVTGTPPFPLFLSEFTILRAGFSTGLIWLSMLVLGLLVTIFAGFFTHVARLVLGPPPGDAKGDCNRWLTFPVVAVVVLVILLGFWMPAPLASLLRDAARVFEAQV